MALTRRDFLGCAAGVAATASCLDELAGSVPARASSASGNQVTFRWRVPSGHFHTVVDCLTFDGEIQEERNTKGLPLVFVIAGVALLPSLADAILTLRRKLVEPGLKIDARGSEIKIDVDSTLPRGTILIVDQSGAKLYEPGQLTEPAEVVKALIGTTSK